MFQHPEPKEIFAEALPQLRTHVGFRKQVADAFARVRESQPQQVYRALLHGKAVPDEVWETIGDDVVRAFENHATTVLTLEWDSGTPLGGSGCSQVLALAGVHVCVSTDWDAEGPYDSVDDAVWSYESFSLPTSSADFSSRTLSTEALAALVASLDLEIEDLDGFTINGQPATCTKDGKVVTGEAAVAAANAERAAAAAGDDDAEDDEGEDDDGDDDEEGDDEDDAGGGSEP